VLAMLLVLVMQIGLGLFASDEDGLYQGPLSYHVSAEAAETLTERHEMWFYVILALIAVHLAAILYHLVVRRENLVAPMLTGTRKAKMGETAMVPAPLWRLLLASGLAVGVTLVIVRLL